MNGSVKTLALAVCGCQSGHAKPDPGLQSRVERAGTCLGGTMAEIERDDLGGGVTVLSLNRTPVNALSPGFLDEFGAALDRLEADESVRAVVLASRCKVFSAGLDLKAAQHFGQDEQNDIVRALNDDFLKLFAFPKPVISAVNGAAIAGGLFFVLGSDYRLSAPGAQLGLAEVRVGVDFPVGPMEIARATLGPDTLRRLMLTGQPITSEIALQAGVVDDIVPVDDLLGAACAKAAEMAQIPPKSYALVKAQIRSETIGRIAIAVSQGANAPEGGWFSDETIPAMQRMIG